MTTNPTTLPRHAFDLEDRTLAFAKNVVRLAKKIPETSVNRVLITQLTRSSSSIGANYREANDSLTKKDFSHKIKIGRREAKETEYWLHLLAESAKEFQAEIKPLLQESMELRKILSTIATKANGATSQADR